MHLQPFLQLHSKTHVTNLSPVKILLHCVVQHCPISEHLIVIITSAVTLMLMIAKIELHFPRSQRDRYMEGESCPPEQSVATDGMYQ